MARNNPASIRIASDPDSETGRTAAIIIRDIKPRFAGGVGEFVLAKADFKATFNLNIEGESIRPRVLVMIWAQPTPLQKTRIIQRRKRASAIARSPILN